MRSPPHAAAVRETTMGRRIENTCVPTGAKRKERWRFLVGAGFAVALLAGFGRPLLTLISYTAGSQLHSYILLVPLISGYLLYQRRDRLPKNYVTDLPLGTISLAGGLLVLAFTYSLDMMGRASAIGDRLTLLIISFLCCLAAGGFFFLGRNWMRAAAFPVGYLIFMVPMPNTMTNTLEQASSIASAEMANVLFRLTDVPFLRAGQIFQLPNITLEVAQECSGIRSSLVLLITSILAANLFLRTTWRRFALVAIVIPLGILRNGFRILVIGLLCVNMGPQMIHSLVHRRGGPVFFMLSLIPLFVLLWWLRRGDNRTE